MDTLDRAIGDYAAGVFLRYFRQGTLAGAAKPRLDLARDMDLLRAHWALSEPVRMFLSHVLTHRHEAQSLLQFVRRADDAVARGRIDAPRTMLAPADGGPSVAGDLRRAGAQFRHGPNQVVAWVVHAVFSHAARLSSLQPADSAYARLIEETMTDVKGGKAR